MANMGFSKCEGLSVADLLEPGSNAESKLIYVSPETKVRQAIETMRQHELSRLPVAKGEMPIAAAEVMGSISEDSLMQKSFGAHDFLDRSVEEVLDPSLPVIGLGESAMTAVSKLEISPVLLVLDAGKPHALLTESHLMNSEIAKQRLKVDTK